MPLEALSRIHEHKIIKSIHQSLSKFLMGLILISFAILMSSILPNGNASILLMRMLVGIYRLANCAIFLLLSYELSRQYEIAVEAMCGVSLVLFGGVFADCLQNIFEIKFFVIALGIPLLSLVIIKGCSVLLNKGKLGIVEKIPKAITIAYGKLLLSLFSLVVTFALVTLLQPYMRSFTITVSNGFLASMKVLSHSFWLYLVIMLLMQRIWYEGLHGDAMLAPFFEPILIILTLFNIGQSLNMISFESIINTSFYTTFMGASGSGLTGAIILNAWAMGRIKEDDVLKSAVVPAIFNINEPLMFGIPIVSNSELKIPFLFAPLVASTLAFFLTKAGYIKPFLLAVPWFVPPGLKSFLATGGDFTSVFWEITIYIVVVMLYYPFVRKHYQKGEQ